MRNAVRISRRQLGIAFLRSIATLGLILVMPLETSGTSTNAPRVVVDFNKFRSELFAPAFRVKVFSDGSVIYDGMQKVKVEGTHQLKIDPESVEKLVNAFIDSGFNSFSPPTSPSPPDAYLSLTISIAHPRLSHSVTFSPSRNSGEYARFIQTLDSYVPTRDLRCPYVVQLPGWSTVELCERADELLRLENLRRKK